MRYIPSELHRKSVSDEEAKRQVCPKCSAKSCAPCVYVVEPTSFLNGRRLGDPCRSVHIERRDKARKVRTGAWLRDNTVKVQPVSGEAYAAWQAQLEWERAEWLALKEWFTDNHEIFRIGVER